jgi:hypothetical protein
MQHRIELKIFVTKGWKTMKYATVLLLICLMSIAIAPVWAQNGPGLQNRGQNGSADCLGLGTDLPVLPLSAEEEYWLLYMREEEKLARDVYRTFYEQWHLRIFDSIAASEQRHFDAIGKLIERYGLTDSARVEPGLFNDIALQGDYEKLIPMGMESAWAALEVGVIIEEQDITDLREAMGKTDKTDILRVYTNLLNGSLNHLDAFMSHIEVVAGR